MLGVSRAFQRILRANIMTASHRSIRIADKDVPLTIRPSIDITEVQGFQPFNDWVSALDKEMRESAVAKRVSVNSVEVTDVDQFGNGKIGFVKFRADVRWADSGDGKIPGIVFARGGAVAVLVVIKPEESLDGEEWVVLTVQPRIPVASLAFSELPAGMLDGENKFAGTAARELEEECGIKIKEEELIDLTDLAYGTKDDLRGKGVYTSPGGSDEFIKLFLCRKRLPMQDIRRLEGREAGLKDEGERIEVRLVKLRDLWRSTRDMKALSAIALYDRCLEAGLIPQL